jgi:hypothetical protein
MASAEDCIIAIVCPLGNAVVSAFNAIISSTIVTLQTQVTLITAQLVSLQIQLVPIEIAKTAALAAISIAQEAVNLVPVGIMTGCVPLGITMQGINAGLDTATADVKRVLERANKYLSATAFLEQKRDEINDTIAKLEVAQRALSRCP